MYSFSATLSVLLGYQLRPTHVEPLINVTPVVLDDKQVDRVKGNNSNITFSGKSQLTM